MSTIRSLMFVVRPERGASATEYAMIVALMAIAVGVAAAYFGDALQAYVEEITAEVTTW